MISLPPIRRTKRYVSLLLVPLSAFNEPIVLGRDRPKIKFFYWNLKGLEDHCGRESQYIGAGPFAEGEPRLNIAKISFPRAF